MRQIFNLKGAVLFVTAAMLTLSSCKKDVDNGGNNGGGNAPAAKLKKVSKNDETIEFGYAADGKLQTVKMANDILTNGQLTTFTITYNTAKQISELKANDGTRIVAHYTGNDLTSAEMLDDQNATVLTTRYTYQNGVLQSAATSIGGIEALAFSFEYNAAGNVQKTSVSTFNPATSQLQLSGYTVSEYDGKANPVFAHKNLLYLLFQNISKNNLTKETDYDAQNTVDETREYTYQYNNQNLPQSATMKTTAPGQTATTETILYSYQ